MNVGFCRNKIFDKVICIMSAITIIFFGILFNCTINPKRDEGQHPKYDERKNNGGTPILY